jgi:hypothetical protein
LNRRLYEMPLAMLPACGSAGLGSFVLASGL